MRNYQLVKPNLVPLSLSLVAWTSSSNFSNSCLQHGPDPSNFQVGPQSGNHKEGTWCRSWRLKSSGHLVTGFWFVSEAIGGALVDTPCIFMKEGIIVEFSWKEIEQKWIRENFGHGFANGRNYVINIPCLSRCHGHEFYTWATLGFSNLESKKRILLKYNY